MIVIPLPVPASPRIDAIQPPTAPAINERNEWFTETQVNPEDSRLSNT